jgi:lysophospholipase L1-like esterase
VWDLLKRRWLAIAGALALSAIAAFWIGSRYLAGMQRAEFWESAIEDFEEADRASPPEPGAVLFTGSSSIRLWGSLEEDMAPLRVLNRGFGGSHVDHVSHYAARIVHPYAPSAVVLYAGDNDLAEGTGKTAESVFADFQRFVARVREKVPDAPIYFVSIKPSVLRFERWPVMRDANARIRAFAEATEGVEYVDVATPMLRDSGEPRPELFAIDGLHLSEEGYALWTSVVKPALMARHAPPVAGRAGR